MPNTKAVPSAQHQSASQSLQVDFPYHAIRSLTSPEDTASGRKRYCGVAPANSFFSLGTEENVRDYLARDEEGAPRKKSQVNIAIRDTINSNPEAFALLNTGVVIVCRDAKVDDQTKRAVLYRPSIINGAQTRGELTDYFVEHPENQNYPSVNFELIVTDDEELIAEISIARNFQNEVAALSIFGRKGRFDELEAAMKRQDPTIQLRTKETHYGDAYLDTEKLIQVLTALAPSEVRLPSAEKRKVKTPETIYRVYAYRHRSRCLRDLAEVMDKPSEWPDAYRYFLDTAVDAWQLYRRLKGEQAFSRLRNVSGQMMNGRKIVDSDGVPDGMAFPMLSALSHFMEPGKGRWRLQLPPTFPWKTFFEQTMIQETTTADSNPQTMGKQAACYIALHGLIEMFGVSKK
jgi:hypothetical protein